MRQAINLLIDRDSIQKFIYGRGGTATASFVNAPEQFRSPNLKYEFSIEKANKILDDAGWKRGGDGIREKDGKKLKYVFQTSINAPRQKTQAIIKQACQKAGIDLELKSVTATVFFSSDVANPDTYTKLYCDMEMYTTTQPQPDPERFLNQFVSWEVANEGEQVAGPQHLALCRPGGRRGLPGGAEGARSGQARRALHQDERHLLRARTSSCRSSPRTRVRLPQQHAGARTTAAGTADLWHAQQLVPRGMIPRVTRTVVPRATRWRTTSSGAFSSRSRACSGSA